MPNKLDSGLTIYNTEQAVITAVKDGAKDMRTIAVVNQKGGCGKTTVSINIASALTKAGQKTLLVDMDPQSHCAVGLAVPEDQIEQSIYDVMISTSRNEPVKLSEILWQISDKLELAPASIDLSAFEQQMAGIPDRESCLKTVLQTVKSEFDYIIIDCPPAVGLLTFNAINAATDLIVPVETGYFSLHGLSKQLETLSIFCERCHHSVNVKVLANMYDVRTKLAREIFAELRSHFSDKMFNTVVNFNTKLKEAASFGQPIIEYDPASKGRIDFSNLAKEIIGSSVTQKRHEMINTLTDKLNAISCSANDLLKSAKPAIKTIQPAKTEPIHQAEDINQTQQAEPNSKALDTKLANYYGVNQMDGAVVFVTLYPRAKNIQIAGDFNNWQPAKTAMQKVGNSGVWQSKLELSPGKYRYRLVVDGQWQQDPYNEKIEINPFGGLNSVVEVG